EQGLELTASFNLSPRQLWNPVAVQDVLIAIKDHDLDPASVIIEITESAVMTDAAAVQRTLRSLHDLGIRFAIDDFGTGYSSLSRERSPGPDHRSAPSRRPDPVERVAMLLGHGHRGPHARRHTPGDGLRPLRAGSSLRLVVRGIASSVGERIRDRPLMGRRA